MTSLIEMEVKDKKCKKWFMLEFSTTIGTDRAVASIGMMGHRHDTEFL